MRVRKVVVPLPVLVLAVLVLAVSTAGLAGCGAAAPTASGSGSAASANRAAAVDNPEAATATAQTEFGLLAGGDFGGAWELWSQDAQRSITRTDFVALNTACPSKGVAAQVVATRPVNDGEVDIDWTRGSQSGTASLLYAGGTWRYQPSESTLDNYRLGVDKLVAQLRAAHEC
ncbi:hypothetical protein [Rugosimonospora africana]|uniref:Lipoprotein n=1 Tax=Rugosimonospora africana TaxID=556532 RepID=A0A8J3QX39_9ACTN|nr:hypothetical protein [Rugosimonospora africana]GIH17408.1 hypothetical protein Raf01_55800 [Rugosimonospora africana]